MEIEKGSRFVIVLKDGIRGHENQSTGVSWWLSELGGVSVELIKVPKLASWSWFLWYKVRSRSLKKGTAETCRSWLCGVPGGKEFLWAVKKIAAGLTIENSRVLFISAGSSAAPWCLALARVIGGRCCTIMTPSVLGTKPFDFAIVPEHDFPKSAQNILVTLGAPNMIRPELLTKEASIFASRFSSGAGPKWGIMIGGEDANYTISPVWVDEMIKPLLTEAETEGAEVYITTSRRTLPETEKRTAEVAGEFTNVRMLVSGTKESWNPVPGMLGFCNRIFCTEDSVSMISEGAAAGHEVNVIGVGRRKGLKRVLQKITEKFVGKGLIDKSFYWGAPRFDLMIDSFCRRGLAVRVGAFPEKNRIRELKKKPAEISDFNEARRASEWIIKEWGI